MDSNSSLPSRGGLSKSGRGTWPGQCRDAGTVTTCGHMEEAAGLPVQPFSIGLNSHYRRKVDNRKNHEFIEK